MEISGKEEKQAIRLADLMILNWGQRRKQEQTPNNNYLQTREITKGLQDQERRKKRSEKEQKQRESRIKPHTKSKEPAQYAKKKERKKKKQRSSGSLTTSLSIKTVHLSAC